MSTVKIYRFSPDFRPKRLHKTMCDCCGKEIKNISKAVEVTLDWNTWTVAKGHDKHSHFKGFPSPEIHNSLFGPACWKRTIKEGEYVTAAYGV